MLQINNEKTIINYLYLFILFKIEIRNKIIE
jgi:hypothetical protein